MPPKPPSQHLGVFPVLPFDTKLTARHCYHFTFGFELLSIVITDETEHALDVPDVLGLSGEGDVVVDELSPGDQEDRHSVVVEALVLIRVLSSFCTSTNPLHVLSATSTPKSLWTQGLIPAGWRVVISSMILR